MTGQVRRVQLEPSFLLHHYPYRDSSRILELFTPNHGRVSVFARASRRAGSSLPAVLQPFVELLASWSSRGDSGQLTGAERAAPPAAAIPSGRLLSGFYVNELLLRLLHRNDPHPQLYTAYRGLLGTLARPESDPRRALRLFEKALLDETGYGLRLEADAEGRPVEAARSYRYRLDGGAERVDGVADGSLIFCGASLLSLSRGELDDPRSLADAMRLLRAALDVRLEGRALRTREVAGAMRSHRQAD